MDIYVYSDESGTFDRDHHYYFVYGGLILLSDQNRDKQIQKYLAAEAGVRKTILAAGNKVPDELKASALNDYRLRERLFSASNLGYRFGVVVSLKQLNKDEIFTTAQNKVRYQDYAFKRGLKNALRQLILNGIVDPAEHHNLHITADEHSTATSGYDLRYRKCARLPRGLPRGWNGA